ncbi:MAG: O-antigen ligase family protein [Leptospiraceae bacterium]|nr:O-antigen ligase family protein [Leptospiraceae bacterium]
MRKIDIVQGIFICGFALFSSISISITQLFLALSLLTWAVSLFLRDKYVVPGYDGWPSLYNFLILWVVWRIFHVFASDHFTSELIQFREVWLLLIVPLIVRRLHSKLFTPFFFSLLGGAAIAGLGAYYSVREFPFLDFGHRANAFGGMHHLTFAGIEAMLGFLGIGVFLWFLRSGKKAVAFISLALSIAIWLGFVYTKSRGAYIAVACVTGILLVYRLRSYSVLLGIPALLGILVLFREKIFTYMAFFTSSMTAEGSRAGSFTERIDLWHTGLKMLAVKPFIGFGDADYIAYFHKYTVENAVGVASSGSHMHNDFINTSVLYGLVGLVIFLGFYVSPIKTALQAYYREKNSGSAIVVMTCLGVLLFAFMGLSQCHFTSEMTQMTFWTVAAVAIRFSEQPTVSEI